MGHSLTTLPSHRVGSWWDMLAGYKPEIQPIGTVVHKNSYYNNHFALLPCKMKILYINPESYVKKDGEIHLYSIDIFVYAADMYSI